MDNCMVSIAKTNETSKLTKLYYHRINFQSYNKEDLLLLILKFLNEIN